MNQDYLRYKGARYKFDLELEQICRLHQIECSPELKKYSWRMLQNMKEPENFHFIQAIRMGTSHIERQQRAERLKGLIGQGSVIQATINGKLFQGVFERFGYRWPFNTVVVFNTPEGCKFATFDQIQGVNSSGRV